MTGSRHAVSGLMKLRLRTKSVIRDVAIILIMLAASIQSPQAAELSPPEDIVGPYDEVYHLAHVSRTGSVRIYEYTLPGQSEHEWSSMITIHHSVSQVGVDVHWELMMSAAMEDTRPRPHYKLHRKDGDGIARFLIEPVKLDPYFKSNVHRAYLHTSCGGMVILQHTTKYERPEDNRMSTRRMLTNAIVAESENVLSWIEHQDWAPDCRAHTAMFD